jgi:predicted ester cyclase
MTTEQNKELVRRQFTLLSGGDAAGAAALWASEALNHGRKVDRAGIRSVYESLRALHETHEIHEMVAEGEWVAVRTTCHGRHTSEPALPVNGGIFVGVSPTGRNYTVQHLHLFRVRDGELVEHWAARDDLGAAKQLGLELRPSNG